MIGWIGIVGSAIVLISCIYALVVICSKKETRGNGFLISIITLSIIYSVGFFVAEIIYWLKGVTMFKIHTISNVSYTMSHWIFQIMLLKAAMTMPMLFDEDEKNQGSETFA